LSTKRGRPRREGADEEILDVARALLHESGYRAFSIDDVVTRTGIAKTTIYRRWPSKGALIAAAIATPPPASDDPYAILMETANVLQLLRDPDAEAIDVIRTVIAPRRALLHQALGNRSDASILADSMIGALLTRLLAGDPELTDTAADVVSHML
jgi:AcrR family transcriptional regulator